MNILKTINKIIFFSLFIILLMNNVSFGAEKKKIAVLNFSVTDAPVSYARIIQNYLESELFNIKKFHLLEREHIQKIYSEQNIKIDKPIDEIKAMDIAKQLKADYVITGTIIKQKNLLISIRLVRVKDGRIILYYNHRIKKLDEAKEKIESTAEKISKELYEDQINENNSKKKKSNLKLYLSPKFNFLQPIESFSDAVNGGYGFLLKFGVHNAFVKHLYLGVESGFTWFDLIKSSGYSNFVPALAEIGYSFNIFKNVYITPVLSIGMNYIYFSDPERDSIEPLMKVSFDTGVKINRWLNLEIGLQYGMIFEESELIHFISFTTGFKFLFSI